MKIYGSSIYGTKSWQKWSLKGFTRKLHPYTVHHPYTIHPPQWPAGSRWADGLDDLKVLPDLNDSALPWMVEHLVMVSRPHEQWGSTVCSQTLPSGTTVPTHHTAAANPPCPRLSWHKHSQCGCSGARTPFFLQAANLFDSTRSAVDEDLYDGREKIKC